MSRRIYYVNDNEAPKSEPTVSRGLIANYDGFKKLMNDHITRICGIRRSWASDEATEFFTTLFDEYVAQLPTVVQTTKGDDGVEVVVKGIVLPDVDDIKPMIARMVNMNACNNRYADSKLIDRNPKGARKVGNDLL